MALVLDQVQILLTTYSLVACDSDLISLSLGVPICITTCRLLVNKDLTLF